MNDPFNLLTVKRVKFTPILYLEFSSAMCFLPGLTPHLPVVVVELFNENVSENQVKESFSLQQTVLPARGYLVEMPTTTT